MTSIEDVARSGGPEVVVTGDLPHQPPARIEGEVRSADELTDEGQFPEYGRFMKMTAEGPDGEESTEWWELAQGLASAIVDIAEERDEEYQGQWLDVVQATKTPTGEWRFSIQLQTDKDALL